MAAIRGSLRCWWAPITTAPSLDGQPSIRRAATIAIHEIGHNCGLDHHGYDEGIDCVMTADTELDCLERLDEGTHRFCRACQSVVDRKLA